MDADNDITMSTDASRGDTSGSNVNEHSFFQLLDKALITAVENAVKKTVNKVVGEAVENAAKETVNKIAGEAVKNAMKKAVDEAVQTVVEKASQEISGRFAEGYPPAVPANEGFVEDFSKQPSDFVWPGHTYHIYCDAGIYRILGTDDNWDVSFVSPKMMKARDLPLDFYEWKCSEKNGLFCFYNVATGKYLCFNSNGCGFYLELRESDDSDASFGVQRNSDNAYMLQWLSATTLQPVEPRLAWESKDSNETEVPATVRIGGYRELSAGQFLWKFKEVPDDQTTETTTQ